MKLEQVCEAPEESQHKEEIETVVVFNDRLFTGADDGIIKIWSAKDLSLLHEFKAHDYAINHLLVFRDRLFSASMDQTIKSWLLDTWKLVTTLTKHEGTPLRLTTDGEFIFSGDDKGDVIKWNKDGDICAKYELVEEVWDLYVKFPYVYSIRDRGLTVTEIKGSASVSPTIRSLEGRAPIFVHGDDMFIVDRSGMVINRYHKPPLYEFVKALEGHERIITTMAGYEDYLLTSGYDEKVFLWSISSDKLEHSIAVKGCPKVICVNDANDIFIGGPAGSLIKMKLTS